VLIKGSPYIKTVLHLQELFDFIGIHHLVASY